MTFDEFQEFITQQSAFLRSTVAKDDTEKEFVLGRVVKISEEFGELCDEVLAATGNQRKSKLEGRNLEDLSDEFADVVITTFLLAKAMDVDILIALGKKIEKIKTKHNKELAS
ncbi:MAG: MazG nucleotide pyrophosphohydrolase domain-containing protein [Minisyncoccota bacterium]